MKSITTPRPVTVLGAGVLGRRIAAVFLAAGYRVHTYDPCAESLLAATEYIDTHISEFMALVPSTASKMNTDAGSDSDSDLHTHKGANGHTFTCTHTYTNGAVNRAVNGNGTTKAEPKPGQHDTFTDLRAAVTDAWLVIEAVPEVLDLKTKLFGEVDDYAASDCMIVSNSSSYKSRLMLGEVSDERKKRVANMHFMMPPGIRTVELMTCGETEMGMLEKLKDVLKGCGMLPVIVGRECTGFVFNRLWAAIKREILNILAEQVSTPAEIDMLWENIFLNPRSQPCRLMDLIGLDTVAFIEDNYIQERGLDSRPVDWLREKYIDSGRLGLKSHKGGLYPHSDPASSTEVEKKLNGMKTNGAKANGFKDNSAQANGVDPEIVYVLDVGFGTNNDLSTFNSVGQILRYSPATGKRVPIVQGQSLPDGIDISRKTDRIFWTSMGRATHTRDGAVYSANLDGTDIKALLPPGSVHTPKQLMVEESTEMLYFCDREGMSVHRVRFDGTAHETLIQAGPTTKKNPNEPVDMTRWCVGIAIDITRGYIYWTQKGPSKGGQGRIFRAGVEIPAGQTAESRSDIELLLSGLPDPIDLELDARTQTLYWTDRGEHPVGCSLNRLDVSGKVDPADRVILARHFNEPIGLKLAGQDRVYVADLGGRVYCVEQGKKRVIWEDEGSYTGIAIY
ncbi:NAD(P)-binding protein [Aspergillus affinis]|uniref:NAD(P)-binding protein n=1 Tax=Aspergillus affinis TaxID=1070780 RepID=UPI0022FDFB65|nr:NAD(P)-binding protein [Aspergillus affinis]KAI9037311.1 NAD(P)-binding protein [Aspergillus affinis]